MDVLTQPITGSILVGLCAAPAAQPREQGRLQEPPLMPEGGGPWAAACPAPQHERKVQGDAAPMSGGPHVPTFCIPPGLSLVIREHQALRLT